MQQEIIKNYTIQLDFYKELPYSRIKFVQGDTEACFIEFEILSNGDIVDLTDKTTTVSIRKADNTQSTYNTTIVNNKVVWELDLNALAQPGTVICTVEVYQEAKRLTSNQFNYYVQDELGLNDIASYDDYPILTKLINDVSTLENNINTAENLRVIAENNRDISENTRDTNEITRETNETNRQNAESSRESLKSQMETLKTELETVKDDANSATSDANTSASNADTKADLANTAATNADTKADLANTAATNADSKANLANTAASNADAARVRIESKETDWDNAEAQRVSEFSQIKIDYENATNENTSVELTAARVKEDGTTFDNLKQRLDAGDAERSEIMQEGFDTKTFNSSFNKLENCKGGSAEIKSIKGQTKVNLANNGVDYGNWSIEAGVTKDSTGITLTADGVNYIDTHLPVSVKPSNQYTILLNVLENTLDNVFVVCNAGGNRLSEITKTIPAGITGIQKVLITSHSTITPTTEWWLSVPSTATTGHVKVEVLALLEGDETNLEITEPLQYGINSSLVHNVKISSHNLYNGNFEIGSITVSDGTDNSSAVNRKRSVYVFVEANKQYTLSNDGTFDLYVHEYDSNKVGIGGIIASMQSGGSGEVTFTTSSNAKYVRFRNNDNQAFDNIQLEEGIKTPYEPYQESVETIEKTLHGFNNVHDSVANNTVTWRNKKKVFEGSGNWSTSGMANQVNTIVFALDLLDANYVDGYSIPFLNSIFPSMNSVVGSGADSEMMWLHSNGKIYVRILRTKLTTEDVPGFQTFLQNLNTNNNPLTILYNIKEEFYTTTVLKDYSNELSCFKDGYLSINYEGVCPELQVSYPTNAAAQRNSNSVGVKANAEQINDIWLTFLPLADKEIQMATIDLLTTETTTDLKNKINEILNIWK